MTKVGTTRTSRHGAVICSLPIKNLQRAGPAKCHQIAEVKGQVDEVGLSNDKQRHKWHEVEENDADFVDCHCCIMDGVELLRRHAKPSIITSNL